MHVNDASSHPHSPSATPASAADPRGPYRIGETARMIGVSPSALRLWERQGLVSPRRSDGRYRLYTTADVDALRRVRRLRTVDRVNAPGIRRLLRAPASDPQARDAAQGSRLRELRTRRGMSLREAATASGLSASFISALERGASGSSVAGLQRLTSAYGATLLDLFGDAPGGRVTRRRSRRVLEVVGSGTRIEQLASGRTLMEPQLFVLAPDASSDGEYAHHGEEFMFVLRGRISVWLGDGERYRLATGDALYFPSNLPHRWRNDARGETRLLWINTPPTF
ncbi:MAG: cupin domain-containing protein [Candidatus Limnocylindria bacterium]